MDGDILSFQNSLQYMDLYGITNARELSGEPDFRDVLVMHFLSESQRVGKVYASCTRASVLFTHGIVDIVKYGTLIDSDEDIHSLALSLASFNNQVVSVTNFRNPKRPKPILASLNIGDSLWLTFPGDTSAPMNTYITPPHMIAAEKMSQQDYLECDTLIQSGPLHYLKLEDIIDRARIYNGRRGVDLNPGNYLFTFRNNQQR
jgi:hypothetical protein